MKKHFIFLFVIFSAIFFSFQVQAQEYPGHNRIASKQERGPGSQAQDAEKIAQILTRNDPGNGVEGDPAIPTEDLSAEEDWDAGWTCHWVQINGLWYCLEVYLKTGGN